MPRIVLESGKELKKRVLNKLVLTIKSRISLRFTTLSLLEM